MPPLILLLAIPVAIGVIQAIRKDRRSDKVPSPPPPIDPRWRTSDVMGLARGISEDKAFERLPILGDALMDAGCEDEAILRHCRTLPQGESWLVGLLLGEE